MPSNSLCHEFFPSVSAWSHFSPWAPVPKAPEMFRLYCGAIINCCSSNHGISAVKGSPIAARGLVQGKPMSSTDPTEKCQSIIDACLRMNQLGINQGNVRKYHLRHEAGMLITPTSVPYEAMRPEQIVYMKLDGSFRFQPAAVERMALPSRYPASPPRK